MDRRCFIGAAAGAVALMQFSPRLKGALPALPGDITLLQQLVAGIDPTKTLRAVFITTLGNLYTKGKDRSAISSGVYRYQFEPVPILADIEVSACRCYDAARKLVGEEIYDPPKQVPDGSFLDTSLTIVFAR